MVDNARSHDQSPRLALDRRSYLRAFGATGSGLAFGVGGTALETGTAKAAPTTIEDFERTDPLSDYSGQTNLYTITTSSSEVIDGSKTLKATDSYGEIGHDAVSTPRGYEYRVRIKLGNSAAEPALFTCVQNTSYAGADNYMAHVDVSAGVLRLSLRESGDYTTWQEASLGSLSTGTVYELAVELASDTIKAALYDSTGDTVLAETSKIQDSTWSGGQLGFYTGGSTLPAYYDTVTKEPLSTDATIIDDFEDGELSEYSFENGNGAAAEVVTSPIHHGQRALKLSGAHFHLNSTSGLQNYPQAGDVFSGWIRGSSTINGSLVLLYGVQDFENRYYAYVDIDSGTLRIRKKETSTLTTLDEATGLNLSTQTWYEIVVRWRTTGRHVVSLYDSAGHLKGQVTATDSTWTSGGIGYNAHTGNGSSGYFDFVRITGNCTPGVIDDFEDGDLSEYSFENGNRTSAEITSTTTYHGKKALALSGQHYHLNSTGGLEKYPRAGDVFSGWIRGSSTINGSLVLLYGVQDFENRYYAYVDIDTGVLRIRKKEAGTITTLAEQTGLGLSTDTWYEVEVDWGTDGTHVVTLYDTAGTQLGQVSVSNETTWTSGGIGYNAHTSNGATGYFDHVMLSESTLLGSYETSLDWWDATNSNQLGQVNRDEQLAPITLGDNALDIDVNSDPEPIIYNEEWIRRADLSTHPCILADVLPESVQNSNSPVTFRFRYHHSDPGGVEESPEMTVDQEHGGRIAWDMSGLSATKLASAERLEIAWYPRDHPPGSGFDYNGVVCVDNVHLTDNQDRVAVTRSFRKRRALERAHGLRVDIVVQSETDTVQDGVFKYEDGTEIPYRVELLTGGDRQLDIDGETFYFQGGSA